MGYSENYSHQKIFGKIRNFFLAYTSICKKVIKLITIEKVDLTLETADRLYELGFIVLYKNGIILLGRED